tara:strand:+ start:1382 stop:2593 length:1212 start_codon:yes stop_codon:yes gene_type:complete
MQKEICTAGFRRITPAIAKSIRLANAEKFPDVDKAQACLTLKKVAPVLGISGTAYHVLDILLNLTRQSDWIGNARPIVAISNRKLAEFTMRSTRTVIRAVRQLVEAGLLAYRDSPTGRRFSYRTADGSLGEAYGLDFSPARASFQELKSKADENQQRIARERTARRSITTLSRALVDMSSLLTKTEASKLIDEIAFVREAHTDVCETEAHLEALYSKTIHQVERAITPKENDKMSSEDVTNVTRNTTTNYQKQIPVIDSHERTHMHELQSIPKGLEKNERCAESSRMIDRTPADRIELPIFSTACPKSRAILEAEFQTWRDVVHAAPTACSMLGLPQSLWKSACNDVGVSRAAIMVVVILEKCLRNPDAVRNPGSYLIGLVRRAAEGKLHLTRSIYGLSQRPC